MTGEGVRNARLSTIFTGTFCKEIMRGSVATSENFGHLY